MQNVHKGIVILISAAVQTERFPRCVAIYAAAAVTCDLSSKVILYTVYSSTVARFVQ